MRLARSYLSLLTLILGPALLLAEEAKIPQSPTPGWVLPIEVDRQAVPPPNPPGGSWLLLFDRQVRVADTSRFTHIARQFITQSAIQDLSQIEVSYDPGFQKLTWHKLVLHRGSETIDLWPTQKVRILALERDRESRIYSGSVAAVLDLDDVRLGDILEYSYSVQGDNPIFAGKFSDIIATSRGIPVHQFRYRLLTPDSRPLSAKSHGPPLAESTTTGSGELDRRWTADALPSIAAEDSQPWWFEPYGWLQISEYPSWASVVDWALPNYEFPAALPPALEPVLRQIRATPDPARQIVLAVEHVQDRYRYLSVSEGVHSHRPHPVEEVLRRGFGDCKDKTRLLCLILRHLGFDASPAFVNTELRRSVAERLPAPQDFDHVIVCLRWQDRTYWLDPTSSNERGPLGSRWVPPFELALVVAPGSGSLTPIDRPPLTAINTDYLETYTISAFHEPVRLDVVTTYRHLDADITRAQLDGKNRENLKRDYLNYYARTLPSIRATADPEIQDDPVENTIVVTERYTIPGFWQNNGPNPDRLNADFYSGYIHDYVTTPKTPYRTTPLWLSHPKTLRHRIDIQFPDSSSFQPETTRIDSGSFLYEGSVAQHGRTLTLERTYRSKSDTVMPDALPDYLRDIASVRRDLQYSIDIPKRLASAPGSASTSSDSADTTPSGLARVNWLLLLILLATLCGGLILGVTLYFWHPLWPPSPLTYPHLTGLGGWLLLVGFAVIARPVNILLALGDSLSFLDLHLWNVLTSPDSARYHMFWGPLIVFETVVNILLLCASLLVLVLFFQKRRTFPFLYSILLASTLAVVVVDYLLVHTVDTAAATTADSTKTVSQAVFAALIWIPYLQISKRVKSTFVR